MSIEDLKRAAAEEAIKYVKDGMVVGLGTGSTVKYTILKLGELVRSGLDIIGIPTSRSTENLAKEVGIKLGDLSEFEVVDVTIDGADEVDQNLNLIKGGGGALLREKIVAYHSRERIIVVDERKIKRFLGEYPLPVEVIPYGWRRTMRTLEKLGCKCHIRLDSSSNSPYITDNGNYIIDCKFDIINNPRKLENEIDSIPGVVESGLFVDLATEVVVGTPRGVIHLKR